MLWVNTARVGLCSAPPAALASHPMDELRSAADSAACAGVEVQRQPAYRALVTIGLCLYGVVHLLLAWLAVQVVLGRNVDASNQGSLATLAGLPLARPCWVRSPSAWPPSPSGR